jgi:hypothetical protein
MIINLDPYFDSQSISIAPAATDAKHASHRASQAGPSELARSRAERETWFERAHGSLWEHGLLDRLTSPLTRYHE